MPVRALVAIMAAGEGKRMRSILPKVLHRIGRRPMIEHVVQATLKAGLGRIVVVVGHRRDMVIEVLEDYPVEMVIQSPQGGTGHAMQIVGEYVGNYDGYVLVTPGDVPFLTPNTLRNLVDFHDGGQYVATLLTFEPPDPAGYGRVVRNAAGEVERIVEEGDAAPKELAIGEVNSGVYVFGYRKLMNALGQLRRDNQQGELYLTDVIGILKASGAKIGALRATDPVEVMGINHPAQLREAERIWREKHPMEPTRRPRPPIQFTEDDEEELGVAIAEGVEEPVPAADLDDLDLDEAGDGEAEPTTPEPTEA
ncbi:MAG TPA: NTP transferase domain-containing protein [Candidatus Udaeobacter sp.]|nr:NTP transferase domain-containing protein [Candidatus Udaeobacter sp.]